jgi:hypothetical protein
LHLEDEKWYKCIVDDNTTKIENMLFSKNFIKDKPEQVNLGQNLVGTLL